MKQELDSKPVCSKNSPISIVCGADKAWCLHRSVENRAALSKKQKRERAHQKVTYDLPPALQDAVTAIAKREDTSASQRVALFLAYAVDAYLRNEPILTTGLAERTHAGTPRFSWNLQTPPTWTTSVETLAVKTLPPG